MTLSGDTGTGTGYGTGHGGAGGHGGGGGYGRRGVGPSASPSSASEPPDPSSLLPAPPAGPGVRPPFVAPPTDGDRKRMWTGLITAAVVLVVLCGGGIAGFAALVAGTVEARRTAATKAVTEFLIDLQRDNYAGAYRAQCDAIKQRLTLAEFTDTFSGSQIISFRLEDPVIDTDSTVVPAQLTFTDGSQDLARIVVVQDSDASFRVCGDE